MRWPLVRRLTPRRAVVIVVVGGIGWYFSAYPRGAVAAYADGLTGHDEVRVYGLPAPEDQEYRRVLRERYGVRLNAVAGCIVSPQLQWLTDGYNAVAEGRLVRKHGRDIFAECWAEAERRYRIEHLQEAQP